MSRSRVCTEVPRGGRRMGVCCSPEAGPADNVRDAHTAPTQYERPKSAAPNERTVQPRSRKANTTKVDNKSFRQSQDSSAKTTKSSTKAKTRKTTNAGSKTLLQEKQTSRQQPQDGIRTKQKPAMAAADKHTDASSICDVNDPAPAEATSSTISAAEDHDAARDDQAAAADEVPLPAESGDSKQASILSRLVLPRVYLYWSCPGSRVPAFSFQLTVLKTEC